MAGRSSSEFRRRCFHAGHQALVRLHLASPDVPVYWCPLCPPGEGAFFDPDSTEELTIEHVPPGSQGGKRMLLTCKPCNNESGGRIVDAALAESERLKAALEGDGPLRGVVAIGSDADFRAGFRATTHFLGDALIVSGAPKASPPRAVDEFRDVLAASFAAGNVSFNWTFTAPDERLVRASVVRSAYLASFCASGYRYIHGPALQRVRKFIHAPLDVDLPVPMVEGSGKSHAIAHILGDDGFSAVWIAIDRWTVLFPFDSSDADWFERRPDPGASFRHAKLEWPSYPKYALDG